LAKYFEKQQGVLMLSSDDYDFPIERTLIRRFAEAAWDSNPLYFQPFATGECSFPPAYLCAAATICGRQNSLVGLGFDVSRAFHGSETVEASETITFDSVLRVHDQTEMLKDVVGRRAGVMRQAKRTSTFTNAAGNVVARTSRVLLESTTNLTPVPPTSDVTVFNDGLDIRPDPLEPQSNVMRNYGVNSILQGASFGPLTRADFVRYAAASGDLTAIHFDEEAALSRGYPTIFAMGMLSGAFIGHVLSDWIPLKAPWRLTMRFGDLLWPGETLAVTGKVLSSDAESTVIAVAANVGERVVTTAKFETGLGLHPKAQRRP
jgi:acyl dehydratase